MNSEILISDDEVIYLIRQKNEEAKELLFLLYRKKMRYVLNLIDKNFHQYLEKDVLLELYYATILTAINAYEFSKGVFIRLVKRIFELELIQHYKKNVKVYQKEVYLDTDLDIYPGNYHLSDYTKSVDFNLILSNLKKKNFISYQIICLYLSGYKANEIAKALNIDNKQINYQIKKAIRLCQELYRG